MKVRRKIILIIAVIIAEVEVEISRDPLGVLAPEMLPFNAVILDILDKMMLMLSGRQLLVRRPDQVFLHPLQKFG